MKISNIDLLFEVAENLTRTPENKQATITELLHLQAALEGAGYDLEIGEIAQFYNIGIVNLESGEELTIQVEASRKLPEVDAESGWEQTDVSSKLQTYIPLYAVNQDTGAKIIVLLVHFTAGNLPFEDVNLLWHFDSQQRIDNLVNAWARPAHRAAEHLQIPKAELKKTIEALMANNFQPQGKEVKHILIDLVNKILTEQYKVLYDTLHLTPEALTATYAHTQTKSFKGVLTENHTFVPSIISELLSCLEYSQLANLDWSSMKNLLRKLGRAFNGAFTTSAIDLQKDKIIVTKDSKQNVWSVSVDPKYIKYFTDQIKQSNDEHPGLDYVMAYLKPFQQHAFVAIPYNSQPTGLCPVLPNPDRNDVHIYDAFMDLTAAIVSTAVEVIEQWGEA